ncbi:SCP2 sterol-binding domain-containing protein [Alteribacter natronophilus]|uniref:SCP2 sterol-binding domain-containing protein n=1 Tax=Alteribacter natronophilus TaxID=2583810 RepID=UPI001486DB96|nr:SCP2 sterol-binding domain-containing protein [Alteribacter natronophilus]
MAVKEKFSELTGRMNGNPEYLDGVNAGYTFNLSGEEAGVYQLQIRDKKADYIEGESGDTDITLQMKDRDFLKLAEGDLNPTMAYMSGKLKVKGDLSHALKLQTLLKHYA